MRAMLLGALLPFVLVACAATAPMSSPPAAPSIEAQDRAPSGMPPPVIPEDCRSLTGILPVSPLDPDPFSNTWAFALRYALGMDHGDAFAMVGIFVDETVVYPVASDVDSTRRLVEATIAELEAEGYTISAWRMGEPRHWTFDDQCSTFDELLAEMQRGDDIVGLGPLDSGHLEVLVRDEATMSSPILTEVEARHPGMLLVSVAVGEVVAEVPSP